MIIDIFLPLSLIFIMFTLGIGLTIQDFRNIINQPKALILGLVNQMVLLPVIAFLILFVIKLPSEMAVGMMILACCPGGVTSNMLTKLAKGDTALSISYTALVSIITVFSLPLIVGLSMQYFMGSNAPSINILSLGLTMFLITTVPVTIGLYINTKYSLGVCPGFINKETYEKYGYYNGGMLWVKDKEIPQKWREYTKTSRYFDQASI